MENFSQKIIRSLHETSSKNIRSGNILIQTLDDCLGNDIFHFRVSDFDLSINVSGSGSDFQQEIALKKALSEFCERVACKKSGKNDGSNGYAAHESIELAKEAALLELIERDVFLSSWLSYSAPTWLNNETLLQIDPSFIKKNSVFTANNLNIRLGILALCDDIFVLIGELRTEEKYENQLGRIFVASASKSLSNAIDKIIIDLRRSVNFVDSKVRQKNYVLPDSVSKPFDHIQHYLNSELLDNISWLEKGPLDEIRVLDGIPNIEFQEHINFFQESIPLFIVQAKSIQIQNYFVGPTTYDKVNMERLKNFGVNSFDQLNLDLHPLG